MATTNVWSMIRGATYNGNKVLTESNATTLLSAVNGAMDGVTDLAFQSVQLSTCRNDETAGS
jgi:hypothetical protein